MLTVQQVAEKIACSVEYVVGWVQNGDLPAYNMFQKTNDLDHIKDIRIHETDFDRFLHFRLIDYDGEYNFRDHGNEEDQEAF